MSQRTKILFFASNPADMTPLRLDQELRAIAANIYPSVQAQLHCST